MYESRESPCEAAFSSLFKDAKKLLFLLLMLFCVFVFSRLIAHVLLLFCTFSKELYNLRFYFEVFYFHVQLLVLDFLFLTPDQFIGWNYIFIIVKDVPALFLNFGQKLKSEQRLIKFDEHGVET